MIVLIMIRVAALPNLKCKRPAMDLDFGHTDPMPAGNLLMEKN